MSQLEPMMAEENKMLILMMGVMEIHELCLCGGNQYWFNIEGEIQKIIHSQLREVQPKKMTGGGPGVSLSPVSGGGTVQPWHHTWHGAEKKQPSINGGGERGGVHRGIDQTRHYTLPIPPKNPSLVEYGGGEGQGVFTVASPKHGTAHHLPPP